MAAGSIQVDSARSHGAARPRLAGLTFSLTAVFFSERAPSGMPSQNSSLSCRLDGIGHRASAGCGLTEGCIARRNFSAPSLPWSSSIINECRIKCDVDIKIEPCANLRLHFCAPKARGKTSRLDFFCTGAYNYEHDPRALLKTVKLKILKFLTKDEKLGSTLG